MLRAYDRSHFQAINLLFYSVNRVLVIFIVILGAIVATMVIVGIVIMTR